MKLVQKLGIIAALFIGVSLFTGTTEAARSFNDVSPQDWGYEAIEKLSSHGVINGFSNGTFRPDQSVTRAQTAIFIGRTLGIDTTSRANPNFSDVTSETSGFAFIAALVEEGVFAKVDRFNPTDSLTRAEMAKVLVEAFELEGTDKKAFTDVSQNHWASGYINTLVANGITTGTSERSYSPNAPVTRVQMAVFIERVIQDEGSQAPSDGEFTERSQKMLDLVNLERTSRDLDPLALSRELEEGANLKAQDMIDLNYFDHTSPKYGTFSEFINARSISYRAAGENIAAGQGTVEEVVSEWMDSPGHRANILNPSYTHLGVGYAEGGSYGRYWVQWFIQK